MSNNISLNVKAQNPLSIKTRSYISLTYRKWDTIQPPSLVNRRLMLDQRRIRSRHARIQGWKIRATLHYMATLHGYGNAISSSYNGSCNEFEYRHVANSFIGTWMNTTHVNVRLKRRLWTPRPNIDAKHAHTANSFPIATSAIRGNLNRLTLLSVAMATGRRRPRWRVRQSRNEKRAILRRWHDEIRNSKFEIQ